MTKKQTASSKDAVNVFLLDTHVLLWANKAPELLSPAAVHAIESRQIKVSVISLWELVVKKNRPDAPLHDPLAWWERYITRAEVEVLPVRIRHIAALDGLPHLHRDPFDRMLLAQAQAEQIGLITADRALAEYPIQTIW